MKILYIYLNDETSQEQVEELNDRILEALDALHIVAVTQYDPAAPEPEEDSDE